MNFRLKELVVDSCTRMRTIIILYCLVITVISNPIKKNNKGCYLDVKEDFTEKHPLLLKNNINQFILPHNKSEIILDEGERVRISCSGKNNTIKVLNQKEVTITCLKDQTFAVKGSRNFSFEDLTCEHFPDSFAQRTGRYCGTEFTELEIGFLTEKGFVNLITSCFDEFYKDTLYVSHSLTKMIKYRQSAKRSGSFKPDFFENINPQNLYTRTSQLKRFADILGDENLAKKYIKLKNSDYFLARGHLAPKADFIYASQQRATFYYINVAPQWQTFNGKNWNKLEQNCRDFAMKNQLDLTVYTGVYGTAKLADINNNLNDLSLKNNRLTVPAIFWKILYDPKSKRGTVFVGHNNPYEKEIEPICTNVCNRIKWLKWKPNNVVSGYAYCCEYDEFKKVVQYAPKIKISDVLT